MDAIGRLGLGAAVWAVAVGACAEADPAEPRAAADPATAWVEIAGELFELELALDPASRLRGLSGRREIARDGGMLFAFPDSRPLHFVMRDCPIPIDVAFLDEEGRIVAIHAMRPEAPRAPGEAPAAYEARLPTYASGAPARFAIEAAGGRLGQLGARPGLRVVFDAADLLARAR